MPTLNVYTLCSARNVQLDAERLEGLQVPACINSTKRWEMPCTVLSLVSANKGWPMHVEHVLLKLAPVQAPYTLLPLLLWGAMDSMQGDFLHNMLDKQRAIVNTLALNDDGVLVSGGDNGSLWFWDWRSGNVFQQQDSIVQPGSLDSEAGIYAASFDMSGSRLVTCEADKTIKMWREDERATEETHPINFKPPKDIKRF